MAHKTLKISRFNQSMFTDFPAANPKVSASWRRLIDSKNEITFSGIVSHSEGSAAFRSQFRCRLRPACGSRIISGSLPIRLLTPGCIEDHQTYIEDKLRRLSPDELYCYVERVKVVVDTCSQ